MPRKGYKFTPEQRENLSKGHLGQKAWNTGTGGCKKGHDPSLYVQMPSGTYVCLGCKRENGAKYRAQNREIIRLKNRVGRYRISQEAYCLLLESQDGECAICRTKIDLDSCRIDHCHETGEVRGLLCVSCNTGIGLLKDSPEVLMSAARYLQKHNADRTGHQPKKTASKTG